MSSLTKEQLKAELVNLGVSLPPSGSRKEEYEKLYKQYAKSTGDFSSDEEKAPTPVDKSKPTRRSRSISSVKGSGSRGTPTTTASPPNPDALTEAEIRNLTDAELYELLVKRGLPGGPVVASTRLIYEKMLFDHLNGGGGGQVNGSNGVENGNGYSSEEDFMIRRPSAPRKSQSGTPRDRATAADADTSDTSTAKAPDCPDTPRSSVRQNKGGYWRDTDDGMTPLKRVVHRGGGDEVLAPTRVSSSTTTFTRQGGLKTTSTSSHYYERSSEQSGRSVNMQTVDKPAGGQGNRIAVCVAIGLAVLVLLFAIYFRMIRTPELTEEQKMDQDLDDVLRKLELEAAENQHQ